MAFDYINEAFKKLDLLEEQMFDTSLNGINELSDFMNNDDTQEIVRVIDPEADTEDELQDSYVGKVIINCDVCHSHIFENKEDIKIEEDGVVNAEMQCPYCGEQEGFTIVGEIAPYKETSATPDAASTDNVDDVDSETSTEVLDSSSEDMLEENTIVESDEVEDKDENKPLSMSQATKRSMQEDFKEVSVTTEDQHMEMTSDENGKVTVTTEPVANESSEDDMIVPISDETEQEILDNNDVVDDVPATEGDEFDFNFDDIDEESMDELGESYLKRVYENVDSFKTSSVSANDQTLIIEGVIKFDSGVQKKTGFIFEAKDVNKKGQLRFIGSNKHLSESKDAFSLIGRIDNKKLFVESLKYNYKVNEESVRGLVRRK